MLVSREIIARLKQPYDSRSLDTEWKRLRTNNGFDTLLILLIKNIYKKKLYFIKKEEKISLCEKYGSLVLPQKFVVILAISKMNLCEYT